MDISPKKTYRWSINTWKGAQHHSLLEKCKSKIQQGITSDQTEWPSLKKTTSDKCWRGCGEKEMLLHCWWECKLVQLLWRAIWKFVNKLGIKLPYDPAIPLLGIYPEKTTIPKDLCTSILIAALFTIARAWKPPTCPSTDEWMKKLWYRDTVEYYSVIKGTNLSQLWSGLT